MDYKSKYGRVDVEMRRVLFAKKRLHEKNEFKVE